jgi:hypothetical protein
MHQRCTCILRFLYVEFSPEIEIYTAEKGRKLANENEKLLIVPETIFLLLNRIYEVQHCCVGTEYDAARRAITEKLERAMRLFVEAEGSTKIDKVKDILRDGSGLAFNGR